MKKTLLMTAILFVGLISAKAQGELKFGAGVNVGLPIGEAGDASTFTLGGEIQGEYMFSEKVSGIATTAYTHFFAKDGFESGGVVPILAGVRIYPSEQFFIGAHVGYGFFTGKDANGGAFAYKPQVGYNAGNVQIAVSYNGLSKDGATTSWIALSGVFTFGGGGSAKK